MATRVYSSIQHDMLWLLSLFVDGCTDNLVFFQNEGSFVQLDELDELDKFTHAWIRIHLQFHTSTEDTLV